MATSGAKADLQRYLQAGRDALLWKLEGLSDYDIRRPLTPTGTNLLGLVKHCTMDELGYLGLVFGRSTPEIERQLDPGVEPNADMWATPDETRDAIVDGYRRAWAHGDETITTLPLDARGRVPWWGDRGDVDLHRVLVHLIAETHRHAGHADIVREQIDGAAGMQQGNDNLPGTDPGWWDEYRQRVEAAARTFAR